MVISDKSSTFAMWIRNNSNKDIDIAMMINIDNMTVSYRSAKQNVNCLEFAYKFLGGGNKPAAGSQFTIELRNKLYKTLSDNLKDYSKK